MNDLNLVVYKVDCRIVLRPRKSQNSGRITDLKHWVIGSPSTLGDNPALVHLGLLSSICANGRARHKIRENNRGHNCDHPSSAGSESLLCWFASKDYMQKKQPRGTPQNYSPYYQHGKTPRDESQNNCEESLEGFAFFALSLHDFFCQRSRLFSSFFSSRHKSGLYTLFASGIQSRLKFVYFDALLQVLILKELILHKN